MITVVWARRIRLVLTALTAAALAFAGVAKIIHPDNFGFLRLLGEADRDPLWFSHVVAGVEIATATALLTAGRVGVVAAVALTCGFVAYHVILGLGFGAPTCGCWGIPTPKRVSGIIAVALLMSSLCLLPLARGSAERTGRRS